MNEQELKVLCDHLNSQVLGGEMKEIAMKLKAMVYPEVVSEAPAEEIIIKKKVKKTK